MTASSDDRPRNFAESFRFAELREQDETDVQVSDSNDCDQQSPEQHRTETPSIEISSPPEPPVRLRKLLHKTQSTDTGSAFGDDELEDDRNVRRHHDSDHVDDDADASSGHSRGRSSSFGSRASEKIHKFMHKGAELMRKRRSSSRKSKNKDSQISFNKKSSSLGLPSCGIDTRRYSVSSGGSTGSDYVELAHEAINELLQKPVKPVRSSKRHVHPISQPPPPPQPVLNGVKSFFKIWYKEACGVGLILLTILPGTPSFICGILWGIYLASLVWGLCFFLFIPKDKPSETSLLDLPRVKELTDEERHSMKNIVYKGWMNQFEGSYDDPRSFHISQTHSVLVRLDGSTLRLSRPRTNVLRHALWSERFKETHFVSQKLYDLTSAEVVLRPTRLAPSRFWHRKYPICIILRNQTSLSRSYSMDPVLGGGDTSYKINDGNETNLKSGTPEIPAVPSSQSLQVISSCVDDRDAISLNSLKETAINCENTANDEGPTIILFLFARSSREKENWFHRLRRAACFHTFEKLEKSDHNCTWFTELQSNSEGQFSMKNSPDEKEKAKEGEIQRKHASFSESRTFNTDNHDFSLASEWLLYVALHRQFTRYMSLFLAVTSDILSSSGQICSADLSTQMYLKDGPGFTAEAPSARINIAWANAFMGRIFWDLLRSDHWLSKIKERIQRKLNAIPLPYFIEQLTLNKLEPGIMAPKICAVSPPGMNEWGLWIDLKMEYAGGMKLVFETKVNLMKLKTDRYHSLQLRKSRTYSDDEIAISPESSCSEDDEESKPQVLQRLFGNDKGEKAEKEKEDIIAKPTKGQRLLNYVDKIAKSKTFQGATDNRFVKKVIQGISDTPLVLMVEVKYLDGILALNIGPPPTDRLWYGFRSRPNLSFRVYPKVGEKQLNITQISDWIEQKLLTLLEKNLVLPNMDDLVLPIMANGGLMSSFNA